MQVRVKSGQTLTEPVTVAEFKTFSGYPGTDQDAFITTLLSASRQLLEDETGLSCLSKVYECEFNTFDKIFDEGDSYAWYKLPYSPVTAITTVTIGGVTTTYSQRGLKIIEICPDVVVQTGIASNIMAVTFTAGVSDNIMKNAILRIAADLFNHREDHTGVNLSALSFDTQRLISSLNTNTGF